MKFHTYSGMINILKKHSETWGFGGQDNSEDIQKAQNTNSEIRAPQIFCLLLDSKVKSNYYITKT
jgi:hypothetical protein